MMNKATELRKIILERINNLKVEFENHPSKFKNEKCLHYRFHDLLIDNTPDYSSSIYKIRWELDTNRKYDKKKFNPEEYRNLNRLIKECSGREARGHERKDLLKTSGQRKGGEGMKRRGEIDMVLECESTSPKLCIAIEFSLDTKYSGVGFFIHSYNDFLKLTEEASARGANYDFQGYVLRYVTNEISKEKLGCYAKLLEYLYKYPQWQNKVSRIKFDLISPSSFSISKNVEGWLK